MEGEREGVEVEGVVGISYQADPNKAIEVITDEIEKAESFNTFFLNIIDSLGLGTPDDNDTNDLDIMITNAVEKYKDHPGIKAIKASLLQRYGLIRVNRSMEI